MPGKVALPSERTTRANLDEALAFCSTFSLEPPNLSIFHEGIDYKIWCFADPERARLFEERYGGLDFDPKDRGKGKA